MSCRCTCGHEHGVRRRGFYIRYDGESLEEALMAHLNQGFKSVSEARREAEEYNEGDYEILDAGLKVVYVGTGTHGVESNDTP